MIIKLDNNNGYNVDIELSDDDKKKGGEACIYDFMSLVATFVDKMHTEIYNFVSIKKRRESAVFILDTVKEMLNAYYDDVEEAVTLQQQKDKEIYKYMKGFYEDFLKRKEWSDLDIYELLDGKSTDIDVRLNNNEIRFCIIDKNSNKELLIIDEVPVNEIKEINDNPINEAVEANAIAIVIYDKLVGDDIEDNPARAKGGLWFDEQVRRILMEKG